MGVLPGTTVGMGMEAEVCFLSSATGSIMTAVFLMIFLVVIRILFDVCKSRNGGVREVEEGASNRGSRKKQQERKQRGALPR